MIVAGFIRSAVFVVDAFITLSVGNIADLPAAAVTVHAATEDTFCFIPDISRTISAAVTAAA